MGGKITQRKSVYDTMITYWSVVQL